MKKNSKEEDSIVKDATGLAAARYAAQAISAIRGLIIARFLGPASYGLWNIITTTISLSEHTDIGTTQALARDIPFNTGRKKEQENDALIGTAFWWQLATTLIASLVVFIISFTNLIENVHTEIQLVAAILLINNALVFIKLVYYARKQIRKLAWYEFFYAILNTVAGLSLLFLYEIKGLLLGMIISLSILLATAWKTNKEPLLNKPQRKKLRHLIKTGLPLLAISFAARLMQNIDKIIIFIFLGKASTGYYGLASFIVLVVMYIPYVISNVLYPRMSQKWGRTKDKKAIEEFYYKPTTIIKNSMPIILGLIIINTEWVIDLLLPEYAPAITTIHILTASLYFTSMTKTPLDILILFMKEKKAMYLNFTALIFGAGVDIILVNRGIEAVAIGTMAAYILLSSLSNHEALKELGKKKKKRTSLITNNTPFIYAVVGYALTVIITNQISNNTLNIIGQNIIYGIIMIPLAIKTTKETKIKGFIKGLLNKGRT